MKVQNEKKLEQAIAEKDALIDQMTDDKANLQKELDHLKSEK